LFGRKTGSTSFQASAALAKANFKWSEEHLFKFLRNPQKYIPGINMTWHGTRNIQERADLIAYFKKDS
jgi:cytochrome c